MERQKPSIGRIVHYIFPNGFGHCPAIITRVWSDVCINLHLMRDESQIGTGGSDTPTSVLLETNGTEHTWHWPERD